MLDRASIEKLAQSPEQNDPMLNVALAEEGSAKVLRTLAACATVGPAAIEGVAGRAEREGANVGADPQEDAADDPDAPAADELDRLLVVHANASDAVRDSVLAHHENDEFFVLAAGSHPRATARALERLALCPS